VNPAQISKRELQSETDMLPLAIKVNMNSVLKSRNPQQFSKSWLQTKESKTQLENSMITLPPQLIHSLMMLRNTSNKEMLWCQTLHKNQPSPRLLIRLGLNTRQLKNSLKKLRVKPTSRRQCSSKSAKMNESIGVSKNTMNF